MPRVSTLNSWKEIAEYLGRSVRTVQRWEMGLGLPVRHRPGRRTSVFAINAELDAWIQSRSRFRSSTEGARHIAYDAVFDCVPVALGIVSDAREWLDANAAACELLGMSRQEIIGSRIDDVTHDHELRKMRTSWDVMLHHGVMPEPVALRGKGHSLEMVKHGSAAFAPGMHVLVFRSLVVSGARGQQQQTDRSHGVRVAGSAVTDSVAALIARA